MIFALMHFDEVRKAFQHLFLSAADDEEYIRLVLLDVAFCPAKVMPFQQLLNLLLLKRIPAFQGQSVICNFDIHEKILDLHRQHLLIMKEIDDVNDILIHRSCQKTASTDQRTAS